MTLFSEKIWLNVLVNGLSLIDLPQAKPITEHEIDFGQLKAQVIHTPGHTPRACLACILQNRESCTAPI